MRDARERVELIVRRWRSVVPGVRDGPGVQHGYWTVRLRRGLVPERLLQRQYVRRVLLADGEPVRHGRRRLRRVQQQ